MKHLLAFFSERERLSQAHTEVAIILMNIFPLVSLVTGLKKAMKAGIIEDQVR